MHISSDSFLLSRPQTAYQFADRTEVAVKIELVCDFPNGSERSVAPSIFLQDGDPCGESSRETRATAIHERPEESPMPAEGHRATPILKARAAVVPQSMR